MQLERDLLYEVAEVVIAADLLDLAALSRWWGGRAPDCDCPSVAVLWDGALRRVDERRSVAVHDGPVDGQALFNEPELERGPMEATGQPSPAPLFGADVPCHALLCSAMILLLRCI